MQGPECLLGCSMGENIQEPVYMQKDKQYVQSCSGAFAWGVCMHLGLINCLMHQLGRLLFVLQFIAKHSSFGRRTLHEA